MEIRVSKIPGAELSSVIGQSRFTLKKVFSHKSDLMVQTFLLIQKETRAWIVLLSLLTKLHQDNPSRLVCSLPWDLFNNGFYTITRRLLTRLMELRWKCIIKM